MASIVLEFVNYGHVDATGDSSFVGPLLLHSVLQDTVIEDSDPDVHGLQLSGDLLDRCLHPNHGGAVSNGPRVFVGFALNSLACTNSISSFQDMVLKDQFISLMELVRLVYWEFRSRDSSDFCRYWRPTSDMLELITFSLLPILSRVLVIQSESLSSLFLVSGMPFLMVQPQVLVDSTWDLHSLASGLAVTFSLLATLSHSKSQSFSGTLDTITCLSSLISTWWSPSSSSSSMAPISSTSSCISSSPCSSLFTCSFLVCSNWGCLKAKPTFFKAFAVSWCSRTTTCSPLPVLSFSGGQSQLMPIFLHSVMTLVETVMGSSY